MEIDTFLDDQLASAPQASTCQVTTRSTPPTGFDEFGLIACYDGKPINEMLGDCTPFFFCPATQTDEDGLLVFGESATLLDRRPV